MAAAGKARVAPLRPEHWDAVRAIYDQGIATGDATFEMETPDWERWDRDHLASCRFVALRDGVVGWAALCPVLERCVYGGVAEVSVYVDERARGTGVGSLLLGHLIRASEEEGVWTLQAGIFPENEASRAVFRKLGFREVGRRERLGRLHGRWRDVILLERRSTRTGL